MHRSALILASFLVFLPAGLPAASPVSAIDVGRDLGRALISQWASGDATVAIAPIEGPDGGGCAELGEQLRDGVEAAFVEAPCCSVVVRDELDAIYEELTFGMGDVAAPGGPAPGGLLGATHLVQTDWRMDTDGRHLLLSAAVLDVERGTRTPHVERFELRDGDLRDTLARCPAGWRFALDDVLPPDAPPRKVVFAPWTRTGAGEANGIQEEAGEELGRWLQRELRGVVDTRLTWDAYVAAVRAVRSTEDPRLLRKTVATRITRDHDLEWIVLGSYRPSGDGWAARIEIRRLDGSSPDNVDVLLPASAPVAALQHAAPRVEAALAAAADLGAGLEAQGSGPLGLRLVPDRGPGALYRDGEIIHFELEGKGWAYLYVFDVDSDGVTTQLFPNDFHTDPCVNLGYGSFPPDGSTFAFPAQLPYGADVIYAVASDRPFHPDIAKRLERGRADGYQDLKTRGVGVIGTAALESSKSKCSKKLEPGRVDQAMTTIATAR